MTTVDNVIKYLSAQFYQWIFLGVSSSIMYVCCFVRRNFRSIPIMTDYYYVYIMTNHSKTLYIGMTNNVRTRVAQHKEMLIDGFTKRYSITQLVYFEEYDDVRYAIERETRLKTWSRQKKLDLIAIMNPEFKEIEL